MVTNVVRGVRPTKPENALAIGFSDPLWSFVQRCWNGGAKLRPKVAEVVAQLNGAGSYRLAPRLSPLYRKSLRHIVPGTPSINSPYGNLNALDRH